MAQIFFVSLKAMLRRKNRLMKSGRVEEAGALARRVRVAIINHSKISLRDVDWIVSLRSDYVRFCLLRH